MWPVLRVSFVTIIGLLSFGCATATNEEAWVCAQGGITQNAPLERAQAAYLLIGRSADKTVRIRVLNSRSIGAYGWPDDDLFVTRGLVDLLTDQELAAAIAHEMGHLLNDGHLHALVSLRGCSTNADIEARADSIGARLLEEHGIGREAMISMLNKVRLSPDLSSVCRERIAWRAEILAEQARSTR